MERRRAFLMTDLQDLTAIRHDLQRMTDQQIIQSQASLQDFLGQPAYSQMSLRAQTFVQEVAALYAEEHARRIAEGGLTTESSDEPQKNQQVTS